MAVRKRPKAEEANPGGQVDVDALIDRGGGVSKKAKANREGKEKDSDFSYVQLRIPKDLLNEVDALLANRRVKPSRHTWLLEAIEEKLRKESGR